MEKWFQGSDTSQHPVGQTFTRENLARRLSEIQQRGWITLASRRRFRDGGPGNTLEDLLGIRENNIPIADYGEFELKTHRSESNSLISLFRLEPSPRSRKLAIIPYLVKNYGWPMPKYGPSERSLRVDIDAADFAERGFIARINEKEKRVELHFDSNRVPDRPEYRSWLKNVEGKVGLGDLSPVPFWTYDELERKLRKKIHNMVYISVDISEESGRQRIQISKAVLLRGAELKAFLRGIATGKIQIEFSARTHHNHGTAFRTWERNWPELYSEIEIILAS